MSQDRCTGGLNSTNYFTNSLNAEIHLLMFTYVKKCMVLVFCSKLVRKFYSSEICYAQRNTF